MAIISVEKWNGATIRIDDDCRVSDPAERARLDQQIAALVRKILSNPENAARLRKINLEKYGEE